MSSWGRGIANFGAHQRPMVGDTKTTTVGEDHLGWLLCDGRLLDPTDFQDLYKVIGYQFGRAGPLFRLPDPAGRVLGMIGSPNAANPSLTTRYMGGLSGEEMHTLVISEMPSHNHGTDASNNIVGNQLTGGAGGHTHGVTDPGHTHQIVTANAGESVPGRVGQAQDNANEGPAYTSTATTSISINSVANHQHSIKTQGGDDAHNNIQPTLWIGNVFIYSGKTGFNRSNLYSGAFPNITSNPLY